MISNIEIFVAINSPHGISSPNHPRVTLAESIKKSLAPHSPIFRIEGTKEFQVFSIIHPRVADGTSSKIETMSATYIALITKGASKQSGTKESTVLHKCSTHNSGRSTHVWEKTAAPATCESGEHLNCRRACTCR